MRTNGYQSDVLCSVAEMERVADEWDVLAARLGTPLLKADWFLACAETLCQESDLRVIVVRNQGGVRAIAPLVLVRRDGVLWLEILGTSALCEPTGLLYDGVDSLRYLLASILNFGYATSLDRIPADSPIGAGFSEVSRTKGVVITRNVAPAAYVIINGTWDSYFQSLSGKSRYEFKRLRKQMERTGPVAFRVERPSSREQLQVMLHELCRIESAGWKGKSGTAMLMNDRIRRFVTRYSERVCGQATLCFCFLEVQGQPIAASLSIEDSQRFWGLKMGYDEGWVRCAPGIHLTMEAMKHVFECGLEAFEFCGSEETWQGRWPIRRHHFTSVVFYPLSLSGFQAFTGDLHRFVWNRMRQFVVPAVSRASCSDRNRE